MSRINFIPAQGKPLSMLARNPIFRAMARRPMPERQRVNVELPAHAALWRISNGTPATGDRDELAVMANVIMVLAEKHCSADDLGDAIAAQNAILRADHRATQGKPWNFDGPGRMAMLQALSTHQQQITQLGQVCITDAMLTIMERVDKGQVFKIKGVAA